MTDFSDEIPDDEYDLCERALREAAAALASPAEPDAQVVNQFVLANADCLAAIYIVWQPQLRFDVWARRRVVELWREVTPRSA